MIVAIPAITADYGSNNLNNSMDIEHMLVRDKHGFWYVIPADMFDDFDNWISQENQLQSPFWAKKIEGPPHTVIFKEYRIS